MILFDTDICVEILRGNRSLAEQRKAYDEPVAVSFMTVAELYYGAYKSSRVTKTTMERCTFLVTGNTRHFEMIDGLEMRNWRSLR